jgi:hypothetical protein
MSLRTFNAFLIMKINVIRLCDLIKLSGRCYILLFVVSIVLMYAMILWSGLLARVGYFVRYDVIFVPAFIVALFLMLWKKAPKQSDCCVISLMLLLCAMVLSGVWASGVSDHSLLAGFLPFSDASGYVDGTLGLLQNGTLSSWASRRPLNSLLQAFLLVICNGNFRCVLAVLVFCGAFSMALTVCECRKHFGHVAACILFVGLFFFYLRFIGTTLSEHLGIIFGSLAAALLFRAMRTSSNINYCVALFMLSIALFARAGAFFVLPPLVLIAPKINKYSPGHDWRRIAIAASAVAAAAMLNSAVIWTIGHKDALMGNFSYSLYGLVHGGDWTQVIADHPHIKDLPETHAYGEIYRLAIKRIHDRPQALLEGGIRAYRAAFSNNGLFSFVLFLPLGHHIHEARWSLSNEAENKLVRRVSAQPMLFAQTTAAYGWSYALFLLSIAGCAYLVVQHKIANGLCIIMVGVGIMTSVPFAPMWDADSMRAYAATMPLMLAFPAIGMQSAAEFVVRKLKIRTTAVDPLKHSIGNCVLPYFSVIMTAALVCALLLFNMFRPSLDSFSDVVQSSALRLNLLRGSDIYLREDPRLFCWGRQLSTDSARRAISVLQSGYPEAAITMMHALREGNVVCLGYEMYGNRLWFVLCDKDVWLGIKEQGYGFGIEPVGVDKTGAWLQIVRCADALACPDIER